MAYTSYDNPGEFFNNDPTVTAGYSVASKAVVLGCSDHATPANQALAHLTDSQATAASGSTSQVVFALLELMYQRYIALATADKPTNMSVACSNLISSTTGAITKTYTVRVIVAPGTLTATNT